MPARYAVYYAPSAGDALHQAVTPLLGRDALGGLNVPQATPPGVDPVFLEGGHPRSRPLRIARDAQGAFRTPPFGNGQPAVALHG
mgnify:FL=1